jgi:putative beta-1,4-xylosyltransferase IRX9
MASPKHHHNKPSSTTKKKRRPLLLRRAMLHSCLCFLLGLLTGLAPSDWADAASRAANAQVFRAVRAINHTAALLQLKTRTTSTSYHHQQHQEDHHQLLVVTTTTGLSPERERRSAALTRTAHALRLVSPPVLWLVVEAAREAPPTATLLRRTGVVYRHLTFTDNFTSDAWEEERHHQRNVALGHIEQHRLRGVVFFAGLADVYDLRLLEQLRRIRCVRNSWILINRSSIHSFIRHSM